MDALQSVWEKYLKEMGELDEAPNTDAQHDPEEPKETDKMLEKKEDSTTTTAATTTGTAEVPKPTTKSSDELISKTVPIKPEKKKEANGEEIINIPETEADPAMNPVTEEGREVKPKKIPIGGIKMPGFFTKIKPRGEGDGADGELLEREGDDNKANENEEKPKKDEKKPGIGERIRNFFSKKKKDETKSTEAPVDNEEPPPKKGLLNAIKLPIANMIPKKKTEDDVELGTGPGTKAGLASMETLDDSLKDQDTVDKVPKVNGDDLEKIKSEEMKMGEKPLAGKDDETYDSCMDRIRHYKCSLDDALIVLGLLLFFILVGIIIAVLTWENAASAPIREGRFIDAQTSCGMVEGLKEDGAFVFRGIPYAVPPVGENRWKPAKLIDNIVNCWNGTLKTHNETDVCAQILANGTKVGVEDCLTLDVVTPYVRYENPLPVIVLIGAESLTGGSPSALKPSPKIAKSKEVVFVRPNFRMGVLGFLALDALSKSTRPPTSGNYALSDIIAVLKWVELNIAHFGGDKSSVILVGHRAGATLVSALVTSREVKKLYSRAWVTSSATIFPGKPLADSERRNQEYLDLISCNDTDCLRNESTDDVLNATPDTWRHYPADLPSVEENTTAKHEWLVLDGQILQQNPVDVWKNEIESLKIVIGSTAHGSHSEKLHLKYTEWTPEIVQKYVEESKIGALGLTELALRKYNATYQGLVSMISDIRTICPLLTIAQTQYNNNIPQPAVPFYIVTHPDSTTGLADADTDVKAIFGHYDAQTLEQKKFVSTIQKLFFRYVTHGDVALFDSRRRVININHDATSLEEYPNCNLWISNDIVPRYSRVD